MSPDRAAPPGRLGRWARRAAITVAGSLAVAAGLAMVVLPGPGLVTIALGLGLLGREYPWAARLDDDVRARLVAAGRTVRRRSQRRRAPAAAMPPVALARPTLVATTPRAAGAPHPACPRGGIALTCADAA